MILFEFLKIIGYILLTLLLMILALILLLLFIPVLYRFDINSDNGFVLNGRLKVLFGLISADIASDAEGKFIINVLGFPVKSINTDEDAAGEIDNKKLKEEETLFNMSVNLNNSNKTEFKESSDFVGEDSGLLSKLKAKILSIFNKIAETIIRIINFIKNIASKIERIIEFITDENVITAFTGHKSRVFRILTHILPNESDMVLSFGLDDPASVGYILAIISPYYGLYGNWLTIDPHFDEAIFNLNGKIKGRFHLYYLIWHFIRVYFDKNVKAIRNKYKTSGQGEI